MYIRDSIKYEIETPIKGATLKAAKNSEQIPYIALYPDSSNNFIDNYIADEFKKVAEVKSEGK